MQNIWNHNLSWATIYNNVTIYSGSYSPRILYICIYIYIYITCVSICIICIYYLLFGKISEVCSFFFRLIYMYIYLIFFCTFLSLLWPFLYFMLIFYDHAAAQEKRKVRTIPWRAKNEDILEVCIVCSIFHIKNFAPSRSFNNLRHFSEKRMQELISKRNI